MSDSTSSVSVVIPAHNAEKYLGAAIESVRSQTLAPHEIIVVDDGSTDGTARIAQSFADVKTIFQENSGAAAARNNGAQNARGEFFATWFSGKRSSSSVPNYRKASARKFICPTKIFRRLRPARC
jgi:cellulose synthase/poly-beta-1,6-N-acetylglucosamine synthase-like glycosyltransferase